MTQPLLPPRGIFIPTHMIFNPQLPPSVLFTWIQLRCLAWGGWVTPSLSMRELTKIIGKSQATLYRHMSLLRYMDALCWRSTGKGTIKFSFPEEPLGKPKYQSGPPNLPDSKVLNSINPELPDPPSYFPAQILGYLTFQEDEERFSNVEQESKKLDDVSEEEMDCEGERGFLNSQNCNLTNMQYF
jgi:hypothetical protein